MNTITKTKQMTLCGLFAALTAICSWISIPLGFTPVPVNLATLAVFLAGGLLGPKYGPVSISVYALAGAVGIPVFAGFRGGLSVLAGPTGGYIWGYILAAFVTGIIISACSGNGSGNGGCCGHSGSRTRDILVCIIATISGLAACYALGTLWFMVSTGTGIGAALISCVIPFLPGDALKITASVILIRKLRVFV